MKELKLDPKIEAEIQELQEKTLENMIIMFGPEGDRQKGFEGMLNLKLMKEKIREMVKAESPEISSFFIDPVKLKAFEYDPITERAEADKILTKGIDELKGRADQALKEKQNKLGFQV